MGREGGGGPGRGVMAGGAEELRSLVVRTREVVLFTTVIGVVTGLAVAVLDRITVEEVLHAVQEAPLVVQVLAPGVGLVLTALVLRHLGGDGSPATAEEYVRAVTHPEVPFSLRTVPARLLGTVATLGLGGAGGMEGPSIFVGAAAGAGVFGRLRRRLRGVDRRAALVAGAAAGVAAIFKAPATGAVFALEVPFQDDLAPRSILPALVGAASGYTSYVLVNGTEPLFAASGHVDLALVDLAVAAVIGLVCGVGARVFTLVMSGAKALADRVELVPRVAAAAVVLGALAWASDAWFDGEALSLGPGYGTVDLALDPDRGLWIVVVLATVRVVATGATVAGGGVAGLFIPLVVQGALTGRVLAELFGSDDQSLFVIVGVAAFLGAGYRVPLAAVMFIAEATGRPGYVVPGLLASTLGQLVMGEASVSAYQRRRHEGHLEERADLPIEAVLSTDPATAAPDATVAEFYTEHVALARRPAVPLVDEEGKYLGLVLLDDVLAVEPEAWAGLALADVARDDVPVGRPDWTLGQALRAMIDADLDHLPIVDRAGGLRGVVTSAAIIDRSRLMDRLDPEPGS